MPLDARTAAARGLGDVISGKSLNQVLPPLLDAVAPRDRGLLQQLCYGTLRRGPRLQALLDQLLEKPLRERDRDVQGLLLCGLYQLEELRIPEHAAVDATVGATRQLGKAWARGLANAILRRYLRERDDLAGRLDQAAAACHPRWLYDALQAQWPGQQLQIIEANNSQPPMCLRVNARHLARESYLALLAEADVAAHAGHLSPQATYLATPRDVEQLPGFARGEVSVQDEAAQMAALILAAAPGERILDACAAPGGKACHILEIQPGLAELVAMDSDPQRLSRISDNVNRLGLEATIVAGDAADPPPQLAAGSFDAILVDAPCSATGVIRRHPDIKLLRRESDIARFADQQLRILQGVWPLLRAGGRLLYATCSVLAQENGQVVSRFIARCPDASLQTVRADWGEALPEGRQLLPTADGPDGLFYALLHKHR